VLKQAVQAGQIVRWQDMTFDVRDEAIGIRRAMEELFRSKASAQAATSAGMTMES
jgi:hypothetical protein